MQPDRRSTPNPLGKIMNSSISSIQSENRPMKKQNFDKKPSKVQEDVETHVKFQTKKIEKEMSMDWSDLLEHCLNEEIMQAESILIEEIENFIGKNLNDNYMKLRENCINSIDEKYRNKGFKIMPTELQLEYIPRIGLTRAGRGKRNIEKIRIESDDVAFDSSSTDSNDLRLEVVKFIERSIENLAGKFEKISRDVIMEEISGRIMKIKNMVAAEVQEFIAETGQLMRRNLEKLAEDREREIAYENKEKSEKAFSGKDRSDAMFMNRERNEGGYGNNKEKSENFKESFSSNYAAPDKSYKPKYEENYEFIENLANNYTGYKSNTAENQSLSGSFTKESKNLPRKPPKKDEKMAIPRTDAASVLQQFLKK